MQLYAGRMQKGLQPRGHELPTAVTALEALTRIQKRAFDLTDTTAKENNMDLSSMKNLDRLEKELDEIVAKLKSKNESDDDSSYEDVSNPTADASNSDADDGDDDQEDDDDELDKVLRKATVNRFVQENDAPTNRPGELKTTDHDTYKTKVSAMVDNISATENCSKTEALRRLRERHPDMVAGNPVTKGAPAATFEGHVAVEMRKGCNYQTAAQRVMNAHGNLLPHRITKTDAASFEFEGVADDLWKNDASMSRTEALRAARRANPSLFKRMQR